MLVHLNELSKRELGDKTASDPKEVFDEGGPVFPW
jgi:hypothetical protein